jgi:hypothetical protein
MEVLLVVGPDGGGRAAHHSSDRARCLVQHLEYACDHSSIRTTKTQLWLNDCEQVA